MLWLWAKPTEDLLEVIKSRLAGVRVERVTIEAFGSPISVRVEVKGKGKPRWRQQSVHECATLAG